MFATLARRLTVLPLMLLGMTLITFVITHLIPADPARVAAGLNASSEQVERMREQMGLNKPLLAQYVDYLTDLLRGDWGASAVSQRPVLPDIAVALPATLELLVVVTLGFLVLGLPVGILIGSSRSKLVSALLSFLSYLGMAFPVFWLGLMLQIVFYRDLQWLPAVGRVGAQVQAPATVTGFYILDSLITGNWDALGSSLRHIVMPAACLVLARFAVTARFVAGGVQEALGSDYVRTGKAKGLSRFSILYKHALRNVLIPVNTMLGLQFGWLLGGSILIEAVFSWPGIGWYAWRSIVSLDFLPIMGVTLVFSTAFILINLVTDLLYQVLDPRISAGGSA